MSFKNDQVYCDVYECNWRWSPIPGGNKQCPGCGTWYDSQGKFLDIGPYRRAEERLKKAALDHFRAIEQRLYMINRRTREIHQRLYPKKKRKKRGNH